MSNIAPAPAHIREQTILSLLQETGTVRARELVGRFGVTAMTVWRDFRRLEEQGLVRSFHGGVTAVRLADHEVEFESKARVARRAKVAMAKHVAKKWIRNGMTIALEGGTTASMLIEFLPARGVSLVTNSLPVAARLRLSKPELPVWLPGGSLSPVSGNLCGPDAMRGVRRRRIDLAIISATGFTWERGLLDPNPLEIEVKRAMCESAATTLVLLDSGKFGRESAFPVIPLRRVSTLVSDRPVPGDFTELLERAGVPVEIARPS
ncbi:MAG: DeoR/GlpR family DNA-binding transcription regulator [Opitutaceae bacterium]|nr:DeoR/GlpR family DNA-binding transcription regulator [Opitutaceae bacterium]